jgi:hypothetical protein
VEYFQVLFGILFGTFSEGGAAHAIIRGRHIFNTSILDVLASRAWIKPLISNSFV